MGKSEEGVELFRRLVGAQAAAGYEAEAAVPNSFGSAMYQAAMDTVFGGVWLRPGLDLRARSLVTLGMVIAMRLPHETKNHARGALLHGCTRAELEEVVLHCSAYVGFPAAGIALGAIRAAVMEHEAAGSPS